MTLVSELQHELAWRRDAFLAELDRHGAPQVAWTFGAGAGAAVARSAAVVRAAVAGVTDLADLPADVERLERAREALHGGQQVWDHFRSRILQRRVPAVADFLQLADDHAVACADEVHARRPGSTREPPLIFLSEQGSPFVQPRRTSFLPTGLDEARAHQLRAAIRELPVSLLGLPWAAATDPGALVVVAHEVGHVLVEELDLASAHVGASTDLAPSEAWAAWSEELLADACGVHFAGASYVAALCRSLARAPTFVRGEVLRKPGAWGDYPPLSARVRFVVALLGGSQGDAQWRSWRQVYGSGWSPDAGVRAIEEQAMAAASAYGELVTSLAGPRRDAAIAGEVSRKLREENGAGLAGTDPRDFVAGVALERPTHALALKQLAFWKDIRPVRAVGLIPAGAGPSSLPQRALDQDAARARRLTTLLLSEDG